MQGTAARIVFLHCFQGYGFVLCGCSVGAGVDVSRNAVTRMQRMRNVCDRMRRACGRLLDVSRNAVTVISGACGKGRGLKLLLYAALNYSCMRY